MKKDYSMMSASLHAFWYSNLNSFSNQQGKVWSYGRLLDVSLDKTLEECKG